jgi:hypothetical protein
LKINRKPLESSESSSPIVTRAVAAGLANQYIDAYQFNAWQQLALRGIGLFPQSVARWIISRFETLSGLQPEKVRNLSIDQLIGERLADYRHLKSPFPAIIVGSALGGATAHLSLALSGPFLPQAFVFTLKGGSKDGDINTYFHRSADLAIKIAENNPHILTIQHYDPIHDEWMTRYVNHLRLKLIDLPDLYREFIKKNLQPGGVIYYLNCQAKWLRYRLGERRVFQVGGWGDISPQEYIYGSERIDRYCKKVNLNNCRWQLTDYPLEEGPESEWGSEDGLLEALQDYCQHQGYQFFPVNLPDPNSFSWLAFKSQQYLVQKSGQEASGVFIEMFSQFDATAVKKSRLLPLWLVFNTVDSLEFLRAAIQNFPKDKPVFFSPLSTFTLTPDIVPWSDWERVLDRFDWKNIGSRKSHYPADAKALISWSKLLRDWVDHNLEPITMHLFSTEFESILINLFNDGTIKKVKL